MAFGNRDDQTQVGLGQLALGFPVVAFDATSQGDLLAGRQQRRLANRREVHAHRVAALRLKREIELGIVFLPETGIAVVARCVSLHDLDALICEGQEEDLELAGGKFDLLQCVGDVLAGQIALLAALGKQLIEGRFCQSRLRRDINNIGHRHCLTP